jgi:putative glutamine amidotransferase
MPSETTFRPLIGLPACTRQMDAMAFHAVGDKYVQAVARAAEAEPAIIPALGGFYDLPALVHRLDGLLLTGSPSNVHPTHYAVPPSERHEPHDEARDETTMQELNVALGGSLHARVHELDDRMDHRRPRHDDLDVQYGPRHPVKLIPGGRFADLAGAEEITVNSLHGQAVDEIAPGLKVEGVAPDGTVEAVSVVGARAFALGVQWHPEYRALENPFSAKLFAAFGRAARQRAGLRAAGRLPQPEAAAGRLTA